MLTVLDRKLTHDCRGWSRREFLRIGGLGFGALGLPQWAGAAQQQGFLRDKAVVLLFLAGGPPQHETFDPKMSAPSEIRSTTGEIATALPGITFGSDFPQMARRAKHLAVVRSYGSENSEHTYNSTLTAGNPLKAAASAIYARLAGSTHPTTGVPTNALILPEAVQPGLRLNRRSAIDGDARFVRPAMGGV